MYRFSSYDVSLEDDYVSGGETFISNQIGVDFAYQLESIQYGYGLYCGYVLPNKLNPMANAGVGYLFQADPHEYFAGVKFEIPLFYRLYFERDQGPYVFQQRSWFDPGINAYFGMNILRKIKLEGQMSYPFNVYSLGVGYKF